MTNEDLTRVQRLVAWTAISNIALYLFSIGWSLWGPLGIAWSHTLNQTRIGDLLTIWFSVSVVVFALYVGFVALRLRRSSRQQLPALIWCIVWIGELVWFHQFYVVK
jgi:hypothetical protein